MLVISRKTGEAVVIGENIEITVLEVSGDKAVLGFDAERSIRIMRKELVGTVKENICAASSLAALSAKDVKPVKRSLGEQN